jgi:LPXTG-site transpeptidase (sortase) family protein
VIAAGQDNEEKSKEGSETAEPSSNDLANYRVAPDEPRALYIDTLNIAARIRPMGLNTDKSIQAPTNIYDAGWYTGSAKPGANGALFIDGHASGDTRYGLFGSLDLLKKGDMVTVEKGDGTKLKYKVVQTETVSLKDVDMNKVLAPYPGVTKGLNLMTCTGVWVKDAATLDKRVIVYTAAV